GKVLSQLRMHQLVHALGIRKVAESDAAQIPQRDTVRQTVAYQSRHGLGQQHLSAVCDAHDARGTINSAAEEVVVAALVHARVHSAANPKLYPFGGGFEFDECSLQLQRCAHGVEGIGEYGMDAVTAHFHDRASVAFHTNANDRVVASQRRSHFVRL